METTTELDDEALANAPTLPPPPEPPTLKLLPDCGPDDDA